MTVKKMKELILASKSPRRKKVLETHGYKVIVDVSNADEESVVAKDVKERVMKTAKLKAETVAKRHRDGIIVAADTLVYFEGKEIGQQKDAKSAFDTLKKLAGNTHEVYTGLYMILMKEGKIAKIVQDSDTSYVKLKKMSDEEIQKYIDGGHHVGKAGAYNADDKEFGYYIESIKGHRTNVMGLPIEKVEMMLKEIERY